MAQAAGMPCGSFSSPASAFCSQAESTPSPTEGKPSASTATTHGLGSPNPAAQGENGASAAFRTALGYTTCVPVRAPTTAWKVILSRRMGCACRALSTSPQSSALHTHTPTLRHPPHLSASCTRCGRREGSMWVASTARVASLWSAGALACARVRRAQSEEAARYTS